MPEMVTAPEATLKMRKPVVPPRWTVSWLAPGPEIVRTGWGVPKGRSWYLSINSSPVVSVMVPGTTLASKIIVSPAEAMAMALRSVPGPLSAVLVTVNVPAHAGADTRSAIITKRGEMTFLAIFILSIRPNSSDKNFGARYSTAVTFENAAGSRSTVRIE